MQTKKKQQFLREFPVKENTIDEKEKEINKQRKLYEQQKKNQIKINILISFWKYSFISKNKEKQVK